MARSDGEREIEKAQPWRVRAGVWRAFAKSHGLPVDPPRSSHQRRPAPKLVAALGLPLNGPDGLAATLVRLSKDDVPDGSGGGISLGIRDGGGGDGGGRDRDGDARHLA